MTAYIANYEIKNMICCFPSVNELAEQLSLDFLKHLANACNNEGTVTIALSGGTTPKILFDKLAMHPLTKGNQIKWEKVHFFFADERCVPPDHAESNFGMANKHLFSRINIDENNIHRIYGENNPLQEAMRYASEIKKIARYANDIPVFDWIFLGVGDDGHTSSIFPNRLDLFDSKYNCETVAHPVTGQTRITLTGRPLLNAKKITFMVTGASKSNVIRQIMNNEPEAKSFPVALIHRHHNNTDWYMDQEAAKYLNISCRGKY
jgi:6-phosphogluconolactonase